ncbi:MAG TPA: sugar transferase, partial [Dermatophilaceae bacterium]|nr:sugar transferase [Dermatophilaceae bacterium]
ICCAAAPESVEGIPVVGCEEDAAELAQRVGADVVAYAASSRLGATGLRKLGWALEGTGIDLVVAPGMTDVAGPRIHARPVAGLSLLYVEAPRFTGTRLLLKSAFDMLAAFILMVALAPLFVVLSALVWFEDHGPVFYTQRRVGHGGRSFVMTKFRSMTVGADQVLPEGNDADGPLFKLRDDPRVTRIGRFLRRSSLDELPQLLNVLRGEMSLVGPRPPLESEVAAYEEDVHRRLLVKPGLTGLWQVSGRSDLSWEDSVRLDLYYVENWSFTSDLRILMRTLRAMHESNGAY